MALKDRVRANVYLSKDVMKWYEEQATKAGVSRSSYMAMALQVYMDQRKAVDVMSRVPDILNSLERLERTEGPGL